MTSSNQLNGMQTEAAGVFSSDALLGVEAAAAGGGGRVGQPPHRLRVLARVDAQRAHAGVRKRLHRCRLPRVRLADVLEDLSRQKL